MKWRGGRQSRNVDDRTGRSSGSSGMLAAGGGIGTVIIAVLFFLFSGGDLNSAAGCLGWRRSSDQLPDRKCGHQ